MNKCTCFENACSYTQTVLSVWRHHFPAASSESLNSLSVMHYYYFCLFQLFSIQIISAELNSVWASLSLFISVHIRSLSTMSKSESQFERICMSKSSSVKITSISASLCVDASSSFTVPLKDIQMCSPDSYLSLLLSLVLWISSSWGDLADTRSLFSKGDRYYLKYFKSIYILASVSAVMCNPRQIKNSYSPVSSLSCAAPVDHHCQELQLLPPAWTA